MNPTISVGVFNQVHWPEAGDVDDCWCLADLMAVHAVAPWSALPGITAYRAAAGVPDQIGPTGGSISASAKAIRALYPGLAIEVSANHELTWAAFMLGLTAHRAASLSVLSSALPAEHRYGFAGQHRVAVAITTELKLGNPLAPAHSKWKPISPTQLRIAVAAYPGGPNPNCILTPSVEDAFTTHPLYAAPADCTAPAKAAHDAGYAEAKAAAGAAVAGI